MLSQRVSCTTYSIRPWRQACTLGPQLQLPDGRTPQIYHSLNPTFRAASQPFMALVKPGWNHAMKSFSAVVRRYRRTSVAFTGRAVLPLRRFNGEIAPLTIRKSRVIEARILPAKFPLAEKTGDTGQAERKCTEFHILILPGLGQLFE